VEADEFVLETPPGECYAFSGMSLSGISLTGVTSSAKHKRKV